MSDETRALDEISPEELEASWQMVNDIEFFTNTDEIRQRYAGDDLRCRLAEVVDEYLLATPLEVPALHFGFFQSVTIEFMDELEMAKYRSMGWKQARLAFIATLTLYWRSWANLPTLIANAQALLSSTPS